MNLSGVQAYSTALPFLDLFKQSGSWISSDGTAWNDERPIEVDEHGWVTSLAEGQIVHSVFVDAGIPVPKGPYVVTYDGEGKISYEGGARLVERTPGRDVVELDPSQEPCYLDVVSTNPQDHLRHIQIRHAESAADEVFNPAFVDRVRHFAVLRMLSWMLGDNPEQIRQADWSDRPKIDDARWTERGVPAEVMIDLANLLDADLWLTVPHHATDEYVRRLAGLLRDRLDRDLKVYIEHSNEVWNNMFSSFQYATDRGIELRLSEDPWEARGRYHARRSREIWTLAEAALGRDRIVRVLAAQQDGPAEAEMLLGYEDTAKHVDVLAVGAYFGVELGLPENEERVRTMTLDELFRELEQNSLPNAMAAVRENAAIAARHGVSLVAYEGGQHLSAAMFGVDNAAIEERFDEANRDPRMGRLYTKLIEEWNSAAKGGLFVHLNECDRLGPFGRWGLLEHITQPRADAPKYDAVLKWIEARE